MPTDMWSALAEELEKAERQLGLSSDEFARLRLMLSRAPSVQFSSLEGFDGMLAAIVCSPLVASPTAVPAVLHDIMRSADNFQFIDEEERDDFEHLVLYHLYYTKNQLAELSDDYTPLVDHGDEKGLIWATGFSAGMGLCVEFWTDVLKCSVPVGRLKKPLRKYAVYILALARSSIFDEQGEHAGLSLPYSLRAELADNVKELAMLMYHGTLRLKIKHWKE